jgi:hypothetical protein
MSLLTIPMLINKIFSKRKQTRFAKINSKRKTLIVEIYLEMLDKLVDDENNDLMQNKFHFDGIFLEKFFSKKSIF